MQAEDVAIPVETAPGQVAQVDFGYAGYLHDPETGQASKAWVFVMVHPLGGPTARTLASWRERVPPWQPDRRARLHPDDVATM